MLAAATDTTRPGSFTTTLNYYLPPEQGGKDLYVRGSANDGESNQWLPAEVVMHDLRKTSNDFDLDTHGFQFVDQHTRFDEKYRWTDRLMLMEHYNQEVGELLKAHTNATTVLPRSNVVRGIHRDDYPSSASRYATMVHVDMSYSGAHVLASDWAPGIAEKLHTCRWALVSVWRPIVHNATRTPLAVCDASSVGEHELREVLSKSNPTKPRVPPAGMWMVAKPDTPYQHHWYYKSDMTPDEVVFIKLFDSATRGGVVKRTPHTAFTTPWDYGETRKSVEVRCLLLWEHQAFDGSEKTVA